jgi:hypothetical protein
VPTLSEWLQLMLAEIAAKREACEHARAEEARRELEDAAESHSAGTGSPCANEDSAGAVDESPQAQEGTAARTAQR